MNAYNISIPVAKPWVTDLEERYVADAVRSGWGKNANVYNDRFEQTFAAFIGRRFAVSLPSCTSALHLSLAALGIGPGDEVIIPDITWIASSAPVEYVGAKPVFVDIEEASWCIDPRKFEAALTPSTKAIIVVDLYGGLANMAEIERIAAKNDVAVIEDAAEAFGALQCGRAAGSFGVVSAFSFHGSKTMTTGEGGMLLTDDPDLHARVLFLRDHGRRPGDISFCNEEVAFKYRMSSLQAALGLAQVERADELIAKKNEIFNAYSEELEAYKDFVSFNPSLPDTTNAYWMTTAMFNPEMGIDKVKAMALFAADGIATRPFFDPLSSIPAYAECESIQGAERRNVVSYRMAPFGINLPSGPMLSIDDVRQVCTSLKRILTSPT